MVLPVTLEGHWTVPAILDTGAPWCVVDPEIAKKFGTAERIDYAPEKELNIRGYTYKGRLIRMGVSLQAEHGDSFEVDAVVFVPTLLQGQEWPHPNFIGLTGFLERIRFAVDPDENAFYFGRI